MSNDDTPILTPGPPPPVPPPVVRPPPPPRNGCLTAFMIVVGIVLLLPGLCALIFGFDILARERPEPVVLAFIVVGLLVGAGGVLLIWLAIRSRRP